MSDGRILLAGAPSYIWSGAHSHAMESRDSIFGVVIEPNGNATAVPSPLPKGTLAQVRAVALADGRWAAVFAAIVPGTSQFDNHVSAYWFGITDGVSWTKLEKLPMPVGTIRIMAASRLVHRSGDFAIALPLESADRSDLALFRRQNGVWSYQLVPTRMLAYVALGIQRDGRLVLGVVRADTTESRDSNSLFLYAPREGSGEWTESRRLIRGGDTRVDDLDFQLEGRIPAITGSRVTHRPRFRTFGQ